MQEDEANPRRAKGQPRTACRCRRLVAYERPRRDIGFHFVDQVAREAKSVAGIEAITANSYTVRSTINPQLQRAVETTLQEGLSRYERSAGRVQFVSPEAKLAKAVQRAEAERKPGDKRPAWQQALASARLPLYDVHWTPAIVVEKPGGKKGEAWRVGLADGRVLPLSIDNAAAQRKLALYDVVLVRVTEGKGKAGARAELRVRPVVQGAVVVLENKTGRILAMTGGFSYPLSQLNRATQAVRQPGSAIKPLSYLAALGKGLQPNTLVMDEPITLPPIGGGRAREQDYWTPKNYDGGSGDTLTLRRALENSRNLATVHLLDGGIEKKPEASLNRLCDLAVEAQIYRECVRYYPFVLGAQPVRPIDLAAFYAAIANEGLRPLPHSVDSIDRDGQTIYRYQQTASGTISSVDRAAFYQLKTMMQGVLARGTARAISGLAPMSPARPAPRTRRTTPGSWASPTTSPSRSGSATTMPAASAARSAAARPAAASPFRSSSRSSRRYGPMSRRKPRLPRHRPKPSASSRCKSIDLEFGRNAKQPRKSGFGMPPGGCQRQGHRYPVSAGVARQYLCQARSRGRPGPAQARRHRRCSQQERTPLLLSGWVVARSLARRAAVGFALGLWPALARSTTGVAARRPQRFLGLPTLVTGASSLCTLHRRTVVIKGKHSADRSGADCVSAWCSVAMRKRL